MNPGRRRSTRADAPLRPIRPLRDFLDTEAAGGALIVGAVVVAMTWANSPWHDSYRRFWGSIVAITVGGHGVALDLRHWVGDGAMTLFFLVVGLEIKRELTVGELTDRRRAAVPVVAAFGGMLVPAAVYLAIAPGEARGWAIPSATDIALAVGVLGMVAARAPASARAFLLTLAIVDDLAAVIVIAVFYTDGLELGYVVAAAAVALVATAMRGRLRGGGLALVCLVLWVLLHEAGVHATLAGVVTGLLAPLTPALQPDLVDVDELIDVSSADAASRTVGLARQSVSTLEWLEHHLHPWSSRVVVPVFALAYGGIRIDGDIVRDAVDSPVAWGVAAGLVVGKPLGILAGTALGVRLTRSAPPVPPRQLAGLACLGGIGFTISLVIANRSFDAAGLRGIATLAVLAASVAAAALGSVLLWGAGERPDVSR